MKELSRSEETVIRTEDMCALAEKRGIPVYSGFLDEAQCHCAETLLKKRAGIYYRLWGGYEHCARKMLCVSVYDPGDNDGFPIYPLTCTFRVHGGQKIPGHRDFLGTFMSQGIKREQVGDIFTGESFAAVFCTKTAADVILVGVDTVGGTGVRVSEGIDPKAQSILKPPAFTELRVNIASLRADCVVSAVTGLSREKAALFIRSGCLTLNYEECGNISRNISDGDIMTLRGYGKFIFSGEVQTTRKGRLCAAVKKYT